MAARGIALIRAIQPSGPYVLCGTSFGGLIALEVARLFREGGERVDFLALLDTYALVTPALKDGTGIRGRTAAWLRLLRPLGHRDDPGLHVLWRGLQEKKLRLAARRVVRNPDPQAAPLPMTSRFVHLQEACFAAIRSYMPLPYDGEAHLFRVDTPPPEHLFIQDKTLGWSPYFTGPLHVETVPGKHGWHLREPNVQVLATAMTASLARARTRN